MIRKAKQIIILGFNGTGKTTLTRKFVETALSKDERVLVVTPDSAEWRDLEYTKLKTPEDFQFKGARRYVWDHSDKNVFKKIYFYFRGGLLVFDDCRSYTKTSTDPFLKNIYIRRRHMMSDVILCVHGFTDVPIQAFTNTSDYFLFYTRDKINRRGDVISDFELIQEAQSRVNSRAREKIKCWVTENDPTKNIHYYERIQPLKL